MKKTVGVTRIEGPEGRGSGWMVRITRSRVTTHKWFADRAHGGKTKAFKAACRHREKLVRAAPPPKTSLNLKTARNTSGKVGVRLAEKIDRRRGKEHRYQYYEAFWLDPDGRARTVSFSCKAHGRKRAFALAKIARDHESTDKAWIIRRHERG